LEERVTRIEEKMDNLEKDMATLRALGRLLTGVATALIVVGVIATLLVATPQYCEKMLSEINVNNKNVIIFFIRTLFFLKLKIIKLT
jgi:hypothetical protein